MGRIWVALGTVYVVWGSTYLAIRFAVETLPPLLSAGFRFLVAGALLALVVLVRARRRPVTLDRTEVGWGAVCGVLLLTGGNGLVVLGETRISSGLAALLVAVVPLWVVLLRLMIGERTVGGTLAGVLVGLVGAAVLLLPGLTGDINLLYSCVVLLAALSWSLGSLISTRKPVPANPLVLSAIEMLAGGTALVVIASVRGEWSGLDLGSVTAKSWLAWAYLIVFGSLVAFSAYVFVLANAPTSLATTYAYVNPAVAVLLGVALADEELTGAVALGGLIILGSVALVVRSESRARAAPHPVVEVR